MTGTLTDFDWRVRAAIYRHFIETTAPPAVPDLASSLDVSSDEVATSLQRLDSQHQIALAPGSLSVWMANPFSSVPTDYPVETTNGRYWTNCAWDAVGAPVVLGTDGWTHTRCQESGKPIEFGVRDGKFMAGEDVIHIAVPARYFYDNIGFT